MANVVISGRGSAAQARGRLSLGLTWIRGYPLLPLGMLFFVFDHTGNFRRPGGSP